MLNQVQHDMNFECRRVSVPDGPRGQARRPDRTIICDGVETPTYEYFP
ncbi:MAG: hypothetical protein GX409_00290 [candidate division Zixibacteria bacterium]|nr:hypothetical protein [candidate division Zixibacteria bacterium]